MFQRLRERNLTLNKKKCQFNKSNLIFYGNKFSAEGISPDPEKVTAIHNAESPKSASEVRSLLGMVTYFSRFIPDLATITDPLRQLTKDGTPWEWTEIHDNALKSIKERLTSDTVKDYFDPNKEIEVVVDASPVGLGAMLTQCGKHGVTPPRVVSYASRSLTDVEQRYSQIEREALAVMWATERFHLYVYGKQFTVITDHKPLERIYNNPGSKPPRELSDGH